MFWYMEIVSIEKKTFEMMLASFNALSEKSPPSGAKATAGGWKGGSRARRSAGS